MRIEQLSIWDILGEKLNISTDYGYLYNFNAYALIDIFMSMHYSEIQ